MEISDEVVNETLRSMEDVFRMHFHERGEIGDEDRVIVLQAIRAGLQSAIPLVVEGLVGEDADVTLYKKESYMCGYASGYNRRANDILAKVKK